MIRFVVYLCLGALEAPGTSPAAVASNPVPVVTESQVAAWVQSWQKRLRLEDWKIEARIVRSSELKPDTLGNLKWNSVSRSATIRVLNPSDYDIPVGQIAEDIEYTVVHELVHLQLSALPRDPKRRDVEEQVVNRLADALMQFERGVSFRARSQPVVPYRAAPPDPGTAVRVSSGVEK